METYDHKRGQIPMFVVFSKSTTGPDTHPYQSELQTSSVAISHVRQKRKPRSICQLYVYLLKAAHDRSDQSRTCAGEHLESFSSQDSSRFGELVLLSYGQFTPNQCGLGILLHQRWRLTYTRNREEHQHHLVSI